MNRRAFLAGVLATPFLTRVTSADAPKVAVAKSPTCGCCGAWVDHMRAAGFEVRVEDMSDEALAALKQRLGLLPEQTSCHTAQVDGYFIEGHVPADDVRRLLAERPDARGLAVPGMPAGSPGMEMGEMRDPFDTLLIAPNGEASIFASH
jgi:hypothetical protein